MSVNQTGYWRAGKIAIMPFPADFTEQSGGGQLPRHSVGDLQHLHTHLLLQCLLYIVLGKEGIHTNFHLLNTTLQRRQYLFTSS